MNTFFEQLKKIVEKVPLENESMAKHTNFRIGGPARFFCEVKSINELQEVIILAKEHGISWVVLGGGSNMLVSDDGFAGLVIKIAMREMSIEDTHVIVDAGVLSAFVARKTAQAGLAGFEWAISLPGTIGGAVRGNAGCFNGETKDFLTKVEVLKEGKIIEIMNNECAFAYRESIFKHNNDIILRAHFELKKGDKEKLIASLDEYLAKRKSTQPLYAGSAGCLFKNTNVTEEELEKLKSMWDIPESMQNQCRIGSGWLIDKLDLKGMRIGDAEISAEHGNFVINRGQAKADDIAQLVERVKHEVLTKTGIHLQEEVQFVGF